MTVYRLKSGKWYCQGMVNGERYNKACQGAVTTEQARAIEDSIRYQLRQKQAGILLGAENYSFGFMMRKYVETRLANNCHRGNTITYAKYLTKYFGRQRMILNIKPIDVEHFKSYMLSIGKKPGTVNRYIIALKRAYNILINNELISYNPVKKVKLLPEDNKRYRYLTKLEWKKLQLTLPNEIKNIIYVALLTGLRKKNVLNLRWENIDFRLRFIEILRQDNKGHKILRIPINYTLMDLLQNMQPKQTGYVFINPDTQKPYTDIRKSFNSALKKAGIIDFHFHDLRRTVGTWLLQEGVDIRTIQNLLGHSEVTTTERYLATTSDANRKAMDTLNNFM